MHEFRVTVFKHFVRLRSVVPVQVVYTDHEGEQNLIIQYTSSSAIAEKPRCRVGQLWPKVEDDILQTI